MAQIILNVLIVILIIALVALVVLYFLGNKLQKRQVEQQQLLDAAAQTASILVIDKKKMKITQAGLPKAVTDQTPKYMRWAKVPVVKAKIGPKVMTLIADGRVFDSLPVKTEAKVVGIYITEIKSVRGGAIPTPPKKKGFFARFKRNKKDKK
jgi:type II secretory pathway pseudopilin PulG